MTPQNGTQSPVFEEESNRFCPLRDQAWYGEWARKPFHHQATALRCSRAIKIGKNRALALTAHGTD